MALRPAVPGEAGVLSALIFRSKQSNGYDAAFMAACRAELTVAETDIAAGRYHVAEDARGVLLGCACLRDTGRAGVGEVAMMFVAPEAKRRGIGQALMARLVLEARATGLIRLELDADPAACAFYQAQGFCEVGLVPSGSISGRMLPRLALSLRSA